METSKLDIYEKVTNQIIAAIEAGAGNFRMPWHAAAGESLLPVNAASKRGYRGINVLALWAAARAKGYASNVWATYKQWQELDAQVREGEKATLVVLWKFPERDEGEEEPAEANGRKKGRGGLARGYFVFNSGQVDGYTPPELPALDPALRIEPVENFFAALDADIRFGGVEAFYRPDEDYIQMPEYRHFRDVESFYGTLAHEATHWVGAPGRLSRDLSTRFGSEAYAIEELVAELGAAFVCATLGISNEPRPDHAAYISSWLAALRRDKRAIFTAAAKAQAAVDWMHERQPAGELVGNMA
jgi:antirestriction protein ArdC